MSAKIKFLPEKDITINRKRDGYPDLVNCAFNQKNGYTVEMSVAAARHLQKIGNPDFKIIVENFDKTVTDNKQIAALEQANNGLQKEANEAKEYLTAIIAKLNLSAPDSNASLRDLINTVDVAIDGIRKQLLKINAEGKNNAMSGKKK